MTAEKSLWYSQTAFLTNPYSTQCTGVVGLDTEKRYWIGFNLAKGVGPARLRKLLAHFGDVERAWLASRDQLLAAGLSESVVQNLLALRQAVELDQLLEQYQDQGIDVLTWDDDAYPRRLQDVDDAPPVLYVRGTLEIADEWAVAVVGTRRVTAYGRQVAHELARFLAQNGIVVVSGLARGVDGIAHKAAVEAGGRTLAVLGCGVDRIYPPEHRRLAEQIMESGALISDYAPGTPPEGPNFPPRNRIISGLSLAVVVIEAGKSSGALITANFALEQGRDVFALPGNITAPQSKGTNRLIQDGAQPLLTPQDVLDYLNLSRVTEHREAQAVLPANPVEAQLLDSIGHEPAHVDEISVRAGLPVETVSATLTMMELKGMVRQVGGMRYVVLREARADY